MPRPPLFGPIIIRPPDRGNTAKPGDGLTLACTACYNGLTGGSPYFKCSGGVEVAEKKFEFPKKYNIQPLYKYLQEIAYHNHETLNH